jgi:adenosylcobinamide kinase/adenosylcobinamide-phosphate guanylyltransferase
VNASVPLTLVLGGARSGKSRHAEALITSHASPWRYIATAQAHDAEMAERIAAHRRRRDKGWEIHEVPLALAECIARLGRHPAPILVDCLTLWLTNLMLGEHDLAAAVAALETSLEASVAPVVLVANEVGLGIVPENALGRRFRDEAGRLNQRFAARATQVIFMVAGLPMRIK